MTHDEIVRRLEEETELMILQGQAPSQLLLGREEFKAYVEGAPTASIRLSRAPAGERHEQWLGSGEVIRIVEEPVASCFRLI